MDLASFTVVQFDDSGNKIIFGLAHNHRSQRNCETKPKVSGRDFSENCALALPLWSSRPGSTFDFQSPPSPALQGDKAASRCRSATSRRFAFRAGPKGVGFVLRRRRGHLKPADGPGPKKNRARPIWRPGAGCCGDVASHATCRR